MSRELAVGVGLLAIGLFGYAFGTVWSYPGRAFSITAIMIGLLLIATGRSADGENAGVEQ